MITMLGNIRFKGFLCLVLGVICVSLSGETEKSPCLVIRTYSQPIFCARCNLVINDIEKLIKSDSKSVEFELIMPYIPKNRRMSYGELNNSSLKVIYNTKLFNKGFNQKNKPITYILNGNNDTLSTYENWKIDLEELSSFLKTCK